MTKDEVRKYGQAENDDVLRPAAGTALARAAASRIALFRVLREHIPEAYRRRSVDCSIFCMEARPSGMLLSTGFAASCVF
jgi:hypothetical protein